MDFKTLFDKISPRLKRIAKRYSHYNQFLDENDLHQQMSLYLWQRFKDGVSEDMNESYIIKSCEFHILNHLRKNKEKLKTVSLDKPINEEKDTLKDVLSCEEERIDESLDRKIVIDHIMNNGFTKREKNVFSLLLESHTVREIGSILGVSHVTAVKCRKRLVEKCRKKFQ